ncbi:MAG: flagellar type III secretion system pore protein FliP [Firmicutes bacterium]|nr:flagellar type III secretion system pore protein FliP [Bacillota bacterium]
MTRVSTCKRAGVHSGRGKADGTSRQGGRGHRRLGAAQGAVATRPVALALVLARILALGAVLGAVALATGTGSALLGEGVAHAQAAPAQAQAQGAAPATPPLPVDVGGVLPLPRIDIGVEPARNPRDVSVSLQILALLTVLTLAPAILIMLTSFTRIVIVLSFVRSALGSQQVPPNQVLIGLALFLTFFVMAPALGTANEQALQPYLRGEISQQVALDRAAVPFREFMLKQTREKDLALFTALAKAKRPANPSEVPMVVLIPAFTISELKTAFEIGFLIYVPFLVIDMVVASVLMSMGMLMLPPVMISLPFKLLLFVMVDGWNLVIGSLLRSFH